MKLFDFQQKVLDKTKCFNRVAYFLDMGLGKTFVGSEKMKQLGAKINLVICQKSKIPDWIEHFNTYYPKWTVWNLTKRGEFDAWQLFDGGLKKYPSVLIINYELCFRRPDLLKLKDFTLMLDESSLINNEKAKRTKFILKMKPKNVILLSGSPTSGKYEKLWSQCRLLGWNITKRAFYNSYIDTAWVDYGAGFLQEVVTGYHNVDHLIKMLHLHGAVFLKTDEVLTLPEQVEQMIYLEPSPEYKRFRKKSYLMLKDGTELVGDNTLTKMLYSRQLCGQYHKGKLQAFRDLISSTEEHFVVFYSYTAELIELEKICEAEHKVVGIVNGQRKDKPDGKDILLVQYQAGSYGLNLQGFSHRIIYFTLPLGKGSCDMWEQSKKRIHRIGQKKTCFYYYLIVKDSIETWNLEALREGKDLTDKLFERRNDEGD